jgi:hypothetical protein
MKMNKKILISSFVKFVTYLLISLKFAQFVKMQFSVNHVKNNGKNKGVEPFNVLIAIK